MIEQPRPVWKGRRAAITVILAITVTLVVTACDPAIIDYDLWLATEHPVVASVSAEPGRICPGELVQVEWDGGTDPPECADATADHSSCKQPSLTSTGSILTSTDLTGNVRVALDHDTQFDFTVQRNEEMATSSAYVTVMTGEEVFPLYFAQTCQDGVWTWDLYSPQLSRVTSPCMSITEVCVGGGDSMFVYVAQPGGIGGPIRSGTCTDMFNGAVTDFRVMNSDELTAPRSCSAAETGPGPESTPSHPIELTVWIACPGPDDTTPEGCERVATEAITSDPGTESGEELPTICDLDTTCGNGVCDSGCEDAQSCAADCQLPGTEEGPTPTVPSQGICADQGGLQWQGEVCDCAGVVDNVTLCQNGAKFDNVTNLPCTPDPQACTDGGGNNSGGDGGQCACVCTKYNNQVYPPTCEQYKDCNGNSCSP